jgi:putative phage-type endonuclease
MYFHPIALRTDAWLDLRSKLVTASDFGAALGVNPFKTSEQFIFEKKHRIVDESIKYKPAVVHGFNHEGDALAAYRRQFPELDVQTVEGMYLDAENIEDAKLGATPDGLVDDDGSIEIKCPFYGRFYKDGIPIYHHAQMMGVMALANRKWCDHVQWIRGDFLCINRVYFDQTIWDTMRDRLLKVHMEINN